LFVTESIPFGELNGKGTEDFSITTTEPYVVEVVSGAARLFIFSLAIIDFDQTLQRPDRVSGELMFDVVGDLDFSNFHSGDMVNG
jgi:hypothetical protein